MEDRRVSRFWSMCWSSAQGPGRRLLRLSHAAVREWRCDRKPPESLFGAPRTLRYARSYERIDRGVRSRSTWPEGARFVIVVRHNPKSLSHCRWPNRRLSPRKVRAKLLNLVSNSGPSREGDSPHEEMFVLRLPLLSMKDPIGTRPLFLNPATARHPSQGRSAIQPRGSPRTW